MQIGVVGCRLVQNAAVMQFGATWYRLVKFTADCCRLLKSGEEWCSLVELDAHW